MKRERDYEKKKETNSIIPLFQITAFEIFKSRTWSRLVKMKGTSFSPQQLSFPQNNHF